MKVSDFVNQDVWQASPIYTVLNQAVLEAATDTARLWQSTTLPVRHDKPDTTNTVYYCYHANSNL